MSSSSKANKRTLILILLTPVMVLIPFAIIYWMADSGLMEYETFNRGQLINPPQQIADLKLLQTTGEPFDYAQPEALWSLVVVGDRYCLDACEKMLYLTRQANTALGKKMNKVRRFFISVDDQLSPELQKQFSDNYPKLTPLLADQSVILEQWSTAMQPNQFYLVDRGGWIMMSYHAEDLGPATLNALGKDVLKDMNRLIK